MKMRIIIGLSIFFTKCSFFSPTIKVEVPKGYTGWCYVIPVKDTSNISLNTNNGKYKADDNGIVYVPASRLNLRKDNILKVYDNGIDISDAIRYAGNVSKTSGSENKYEFIQFFLPSIDDRKITGNEKYWRDKMYEYEVVERRKFDSLLRINKIFFK